MLQDAIVYILRNFPLTMLILALLTPMLGRAHFKKRLCSAMFLFPVGFAGVWGFVMHAFYPEIASNTIGWQASPFELEVALANLAFGVTGIIAALSSRGYKIAVALMTTIFLWGAALGHIQQIIIAHNYSPGNAGTILFTDILIPLLLWVSILMDPIKPEINESGYIV